MTHGELPLSIATDTTAPACTGSGKLEPGRIAHDNDDNDDERESPSAVLVPGGVDGRGGRGEAKVVLLWAATIMASVVGMDTHRDVPLTITVVLQFVPPNASSNSSSGGGGGDGGGGTSNIVVCASLVSVGSESIAT
jgi:hypothetical protein